MAAQTPSHYEIQRTIAVSLGATLVFETLTIYPGSVRRHHDAETLLRVIDGLVRLSVEEHERVLGPGEEALIPPGAGHHLASAAGEARIVTGLRPA